MKLRRIYSCKGCPFYDEGDEGWYLCQIGGLPRLPNGAPFYGCECPAERDALRRKVLAHQAGKESGE